MFGISGIYWVLINSVASFIFLYIISKVLGKKQIAQLEFIDYAVGISLGSIAADWSIETKEPFYYYLIAMAIFFVLAWLVAEIGRKSSFLKRVFKGKPSTLIYEGEVVYKELKKNKIDVNDLLSMLREKNYFDINDVAYAIFEPSGKLSVLPKGSQKPVVIKDIDGAQVKESSLNNVLIVDGVVSKSGLSEAGKNKEWLFRKLKIDSKKDLKNIILAVYDETTNLISVHYKKHD